MAKVRRLREGLGCGSESLCRNRPDMISSNHPHVTDLVIRNFEISQHWIDRSTRLIEAEPRSLSATEVATSLDLTNARAMFAACADNGRFYGTSDLADALLHV
jgi:hypothetical protein